MNVLRFTIACTLIWTFAGCVNLKPVRDFAAESAKFSSCTELTTHFRDTYQREAPYLSGEAALLARTNDEKRKAACQDLLKLHQTITQYLQTLARLAGDKTFDVAPTLTSAAAEIKAHPDLGIDGKQVDACLNLSKVVVKWLTSGHQSMAVREMLREGDPHLQAMLEGMASLVGLYRQTNENERNSVSGLLEVEMAYADPSKDLLLATLARAHLQSKLQEYQRADALYAQAEKGFQDIREGHRKLAEGAGRLSNDEVEALIGGFTKDIKTIRNNLQTLPSW